VFRKKSSTVRKNRKFHVKTGDEVLVLSGKDRGKTGVILYMIPEKDRAIVEGINMIIKHMRPTTPQGQSGRIEREGTIHISNLKLICPRCNQPTRTSRRKLETGFRVRACKKCGEIAERE
jgi:large subunit ribosomal protein L24